jgi:hypothetical protein
MGDLKIKTNFQPQCELLIQRSEDAHANYYRAPTFGGPSLYFHQKALAAAKSGDVETFAEYAYAVLVAWGMDRPGPGGSKMRNFSEFQGSLLPLWSTIRTLQEATPASLDEDGWRDLGRIFAGIKCMASKSSLVGHSKILAHALPLLVPPIDRRYTLGFLCGNTQITNDVLQEWERLRTILGGFFYPVLQSPDIQRKTKKWMADQSTFVWDTSPLKVIDNLVIGLANGSR